MIFTKVNTENPLSKVVLGVSKMSDAVGATMGPRGGNVIIKKHGGRTAVTRDGVTVARAIRFEDNEEEAIAEIVKEAASRMESITGDGTTTVTVLTAALLNGLSELGQNPMATVYELEDIEKEILAEIEKHGIEPTDENVTATAKVAAGSDEIGEEVAKLLIEAGHKTPVILGFSDREETVTEVVNGIRLASGPASPYLAEANGDKTEMEDVKIMVCDAKLRDKTEIVPILHLISGLDREQRKLLIVAADVSGDALSLCVMNKLKGFADIAVVRVPQSIHSPSEYLKDIALATGATLLAPNTAASPKDITPDQLGSAAKVVVDTGETLIVDGGGDKELLKARIENLNKNSEGKSPDVKKFAEDRIATLDQKVISILVGGKTGGEAEEKHYRYDDCIGATKAALRSGVVPGGGTLLAGIAESSLTGAVSTTKQAVMMALFKPMMVIVANSGTEPVLKDVVVGMGYDVKKPWDGIVDLAERGIFDPAESEKEVIKTAFGAVIMLLATGAIITDEVKDEAK